MKNKIAYYRKELGISQQKLADAANTVKSKISTLESGKQELTLSWMERLCKAFEENGLKIRPTDLIDDGFEQEENYIVNTLRELERKIDDEFDSALLKSLREKHEKKNENR